MCDDDKSARKSRLSARCLELAVDHFEKQWARKQAVNIFGAEDASDAARVLGFSAHAARLDAILSTVTVADSLRGAITSIEITNDMKAKPLPRRTLEEIEHAYPQFRSSYMSDLLSKGGDHLQLCLDRNYEAALSKATCELDEVEVALAQLLLGDFQAARLSFQRFPTRQHDMLVVLAIELYRRNCFNEAEEIYSALLDRDSTWTPIHLAVGVSGRVPWPQYPFPDY